ncbi:MFS transporter [Shimia sp.]|uniref:MFS transporter n=1 Tax=Shimia sp. TaxID=1954381 RepID=UPI003B8E2575
MISHSPPPSSTPPIAGLLAAATLLVMAIATISPALPGLAARFADTPNVALMTRYLVAAPAMSALLFSPFAGALCDRIGHGAMLRFGTLTFGVFGVAGLFLDRLDLILASRLLLGLSLAFVLTSQSALVGVHFAGDRRQRFLGWQVTARNLAGLVFVLAAGILAGFTPRYAFAVYALTFVFLPIIWLAGRRPAQTAPRHGAPNLRATWLRPVFLLCLMQILVLILFFTMPTQIPFALEERGYADPRLTSASMAGLMIVGAIGGASFGTLMRHVGQRKTIAVGFGLFAVGFGVMLFSGLWPVFAGPSLVGAGYALLMASTANIALSLAPTEHRGFAMGLLSSAIFLGQSVSPALSTATIVASGFSGLFACACGIALACTLLSLLWVKPKLITPSP